MKTRVSESFSLIATSSRTLFFQNVLQRRSAPHGPDRRSVDVARESRLTKCDCIALSLSSEFFKNAPVGGNPKRRLLDVSTSFDSFG